MVLNNIGTLDLFSYNKALIVMNITKRPRFFNPFSTGKMAGGMEKS